VAALGAAVVILFEVVLRSALAPRQKAARHGPAMTAPTRRDVLSPQAAARLPSVDRLLRAGGDELVAGFGRELATDALRAALTRAAAIRVANWGEAPADLVAAGHEWATELLAPTLRPVINATDHRPHQPRSRPLSDAALAAVAEAPPAATLSMTWTKGARLARAVHAERLLMRLAGRRRRWSSTTTPRPCC
jgi:hypothetical protein